MTMRRERGFIPGMVMEINIAIVLFAVVLGIFWNWTLEQYRPVPVEPREVELVAPAAAVTAVPGDWTLEQKGTHIIIERLESRWTWWILPLLLLATAVMIFVAALEWPYWVALALTCAAFACSIWLGPGAQRLKIAEDGAVEATGSARLSIVPSRSEKIPAGSIETVLVHKERPEAHLVYARRDTMMGWRIYAASRNEARELAAILRAQLKQRGDGELGRSGDGKPVDRKAGT